MDDIMSVKRFTKILESSPKKYDVDAIVRNVTDDGSTPITFRSIACYHHPVRSIMCLRNKCVSIYSVCIPDIGLFLLNCSFEYFVMFEFEGLCMILWSGI
eukprot:TRINITY_DN7982_c0_g1_i1.p1 TRINITY_DN7982_c0_g1~~TRINITY_DN7982_c0_g1_i1.p1  ORF type:complete len:108 (+),score=17.96 TRINITY_DN7982_c0_g1_i1:26-325(+)